MTVPCTTKKKKNTDKDSIYELGGNGKFWALHVIYIYIKPNTMKFSQFFTSAQYLNKIIFI